MLFQSASTRQPAIRMAPGDLPSMRATASMDSAFDARQPERAPGFFLELRLRLFGRPAKDLALISVVRKSPRTRAMLHRATACEAEGPAIFSSLRTLHGPSP